METATLIGAEGSAIVEHRAGDPAPSLPAQSNAAAYQSDASGMSASQAAALKFVDAHRAQAVKGDNLALTKQINQALAHAFSGGPAPDFLAQRDAARADAAAADQTPITGDELNLTEGFEPMHESGAERLITRAVVKGLPREQANAVADFALSAKLPQVVAEILADRFAHHHGLGWGAGELSADDAAELAGECVQAFGSVERAEAEAALAEEYLAHIGGAALVAKVEKEFGSLLFDPKVILQFAMMARARGLAKAA